MKFWKVEVYNKFYGRQESFGVAWHDEGTEEKLQEILEEVYESEYEDIRISPAKQPSDWKILDYGGGSGSL